MQLDLPPSDDVMMEVDPDLSLMSHPLSSQETNHSGIGSSPSVQQSRLTPGFSSVLHVNSSRPALEGTPSTARTVPVPPVVLVSSSDVFAWPKFKLDQLFVEWLARLESRQWLDGLLDEARGGKAPELLIAEQSNRVSRMERTVSPGLARSSPTSTQSNLTVSPQQAPGSPVSRLFNTHVPFGDADSSPRSPPAAPISASAPFKTALSAPAAADFDLGRSGSVSPLGGGRHSPSAPKQNQVSATVPGPSTVAADNEGPSESQDDPQASHGSGSVKHSPDNVTRLDQVRDSNVLDRVTDKIAGMSAAVDGSGSAKPSSETRRTVSAPVSDANDADSRRARILGQGDSVHDAIEDVRAESDSAIKQGSSLAIRQGLKSRACQAKELGSSPSLEGLDPAPSGISVREDATSSEARPQVANEGSSCQQHQKSRSLPNHNLEAPGPGVDGEQLVHSSDKIAAESDRFSTLAERPGRSSRGIPPSPVSRGKATEDVAMLESPGVSKRRTSIPQFYFPRGKDAETREHRERETIKEFFKAQRFQKNIAGVNKSDIAELVVDVIGLPSYFASIVFNVIQELFPPPIRETPRQERLEQTAASMSLSTDGTGGVNAMKDVGEGDESAATVHPSEELQYTGTGNRTTLGSDATMGDVGDVFKGEGRTSETRAGRRVDRVSGPENLQEGTEPNPNANASDLVTEQQFLSYYDAYCATCSREGRLFTALREPHAKRDYLIPSDFKPLLRALLLCHQGLAFLHATPEFQQRYSETVIERIYFGCTRQHNGRLTLNDIKRSRLLDTLMVVDEEEDINRERKYFSYEHFYVLYCRFWELDANHDLQIDREDLMRYGSHSLTYRIVDRIFGGYARPLDSPENPGFMSYTDFIWFCLSEEDKTSDTAIDYWFRCVDMDGDGLITMFDMEFFYKEQLHRMECFGHEPVQIRDILCQLLDMINPNMQPPVIRRQDLKRCRLAGNFFNVLFNLNKFFAIEARDPLQIRQEQATPELTDWDRFAALEYVRLSAEEEGEEDESWEDVGDAANPLMSGEAPF